MKNLEAKQEAIKKAYGENYIHADINGWIRFGMYVPTDLGIENYDDMDGFWRCKSLQGIENNNGWIKIVSEADLPNNEKVWICANNNRVLLSSKTVLNWILKNHDNKITHYQPIKKPKPPIY